MKTTAAQTHDRVPRWLFLMIATVLAAGISHPQPGWDNYPPAQPKVKPAPRDEPLQVATSKEVGVGPVPPAQLTALVRSVHEVYLVTGAAWAPFKMEKKRTKCQPETDRPEHGVSIILVIIGYLGC